MKEPEIDPMTTEAGSTVESEEVKKRRQARERKAKQRAKDKKVKEARATEDEGEWHQRNRASLPPGELATMSEQDAYIRDLLFSMKTVVNVQESDPELIDIIVEHVKEHSTTHLGRITRNSDIPKDWPSQDYWKNPELLASLEAESDATSIHTRYGFLVALPDWRVVNFLTDKAGWKWSRAADLVGWVEQRGGFVHK